MYQTMGIADLAISQADLQTKLQNNESILLLDVRTSEEHLAYNIGGILIPLQELSARVAELNPEDNIIVYCRTQVRSFHAAQFLILNGFKSVKYLHGGMLEWQQRRVQR